MLTIDELVKRMNACGSHFWSKDTLKFFGNLESFQCETGQGNAPWPFV